MYLGNVGLKLVKSNKISVAGYAKFIDSRNSAVAYSDLV